MLLKHLENRYFMRCKDVSAVSGGNTTTTSNDDRSLLLKTKQEEMKEMRRWRVNEVRPIDRT